MVMSQGANRGLEKIERDDHHIKKGNVGRMSYGSWIVLLLVACLGKKPGRVFGPKQRP
jgi:hypothetical protein